MSGIARHRQNGACEDTITQDKKKADKENVTACQWGSQDQSGNPAVCTSVLIHNFAVTRRRSTRLFVANPTDKENVTAWGSPVPRGRSMRLFAANPDTLSASRPIHGEIVCASVSLVKKKARREVTAVGSPKGDKAIVAKKEAPATKKVDLLPALPLPGSTVALPNSTRLLAKKGNIRVRYWLAGPESGKKIVLIHDISTSSLTYTELVPTLVGAGYQVLLYDLYGRGYSDVPWGVPYDATLYVTQLAPLMQHI
ncbi:hypothetical protein B0H17DRAFT_1149897 [Mycena rosella]|uniref:Serine aminopeptidase S33 domain-containing protein n=1 Tax=Mycena rosella TaxID=1033263 RepID=A0AAD7BY55_MYCRO|nr:hypothetical protein B0H17DRAFT_1149897 [Mycena rosella]